MNECSIIFGSLSEGNKGAGENQGEMFENKSSSREFNEISSNQREPTHGTNPLFEVNKTFGRIMTY